MNNEKLEQAYKDLMNKKITREEFNRIFDKLND